MRKSEDGPKMSENGMRKTNKIKSKRNNNKITKLA